MMDFSIIISYKETHPDRRKNFNFVLNYLKQKKENNNFEIIVVEQDISPKISEGFYRHIFLYNSEYFNKCWAYNVGAINSSSNYLIFCDCDILIDFKNLLEALSYMKKYDAVCPKGVIYDVKENVVNPFEFKDNIRPITNFAGGILLIQKNKFFDICGWDEDFTGWGGEDDAMSIKVTSLLFTIRLKFELFHLFHKDRTYTTTAFNKDFYKKNLETLKKIQELNKKGKKELLKYYKNKGPIGDVDKYKEK